MTILSRIRQNLTSKVLLVGAGVFVAVLGGIGYVIKQNYDEMHHYATPSLETTSKYSKRFKLSSGLVLEYSEFGNPKGKPLLVIPGYCCSRYYELFIFLSKWIKKENYHIVVPSLVGTGESGIFPDDVLSNPEEYMNEMIDVLRKLAAHTNLTRTPAKEGFNTDLHTPMTSLPNQDSSDDSYSPYTPFPTIQPLNILCFDLGAKFGLGLTKVLTNKGISVENVTFISPHITTTPLLDVGYYLGPFVLNFSLSNYVKDPNIPASLKDIAKAETAYYLKNGYYGVLSLVKNYHLLPMPSPEEFAEFVYENPFLSIKIMEGNGIEKPQKEEDVPYFSFSSENYFSAAKRAFHAKSNLTREQIVASYEESIQSKDPSSPPDPEMKRIQKILARFDFDYKENQINEHLFYYNAKEIISLAMGSQLLFLTPV